MGCRCHSSEMPTVQPLNMYALNVNVCTWLGEVFHRHLSTSKTRAKLSNCVSTEVLPRCFPSKEADGILSTQVRWRFLVEFDYYHQDLKVTTENWICLSSCMDSFGGKWFFFLHFYSNIFLTASIWFHSFTADASIFAWEIWLYPGDFVISWCFRWKLPICATKKKIGENSQCEQANWIIWMHWQSQTVFWFALLCRCQHEMYSHWHFATAQLIWMVRNR